MLIGQIDWYGKQVFVEDFKRNIKMKDGKEIMQNYFVKKVC